MNECERPTIRELSATCTKAIRGEKNPPLSCYIIWYAAAHQQTRVLRPRICTLSNCSRPANHQHILIMDPSTGIGRLLQTCKLQATTYHPTPAPKLRNCPRSLNYKQTPIIRPPRSDWMIAPNLQITNKYQASDISSGIR